MMQGIWRPAIIMCSTPQVYDPG